MVEAFSNLVTSGSLAVGTIIFLIIFVIQFLVISKGGSRIAEGFITASLSPQAESAGIWQAICDAGLAGALAVLATIVEEDLLAHVASTGRLLRDDHRHLADRERYVDRAGYGVRVRHRLDPSDHRQEWNVVKHLDPIVGLAVGVPQ